MTREPRTTDTRCDRTTCGHAWEGHQHFRPGADCSACDCSRYIPRPILFRLLDRVGVHVTITNRRTP